LSTEPLSAAPPRDFEELRDRGGAVGESETPMGTLFVISSFAKRTGITTVLPMTI